MSAVNKTLFEKLTNPDAEMTLQQSVINNIQNIFSSRGYLDGDQINDGETSSAHTLPYIVDQSSHSAVDVDNYKKQIRQLVLRFEPRVKCVEVKSIDNQSISGRCFLQISLADNEFEQEFRFLSS